MHARVVVLIQRRSARKGVLRAVQRIFAVLPLIFLRLHGKFYCDFPRNDRDLTFRIEFCVIEIDGVIVRSKSAHRDRERTAGIRARLIFVRKLRRTRDLPVGGIFDQTFISERKRSGRIVAVLYVHPLDGNRQLCLADRNGELHRLFAMVVGGDLHIDGDRPFRIPEDAQGIAVVAARCAVQNLEAAAVRFFVFERDAAFCPVDDRLRMRLRVVCFGISVIAPGDICRRYYVFRTLLIRVPCAHKADGIVRIFTVLTADEIRSGGHVLPDLLGRCKAVHIGHAVGRQDRIDGSDCLLSGKCGRSAELPERFCAVLVAAVLDRDNDLARYDCDFAVTVLYRIIVSRQAAERDGVRTAVYGTVCRAGFVCADNIKLRIEAQTFGCIEVHFAVVDKFAVIDGPLGKRLAVNDSLILNADGDRFACNGVIGWNCHTVFAAVLRQAVVHIADRRVNRVIAGVDRMIDLPGRFAVFYIFIKNGYQVARLRASEFELRRLRAAVFEAVRISDAVTPHLICKQFGRNGELDLRVVVAEPCTEHSFRIVHRFSNDDDQIICAGFSRNCRRAVAFAGFVVISLAVRRAAARGAAVIISFFCCLHFGKVRVGFQIKGNGRSLLCIAVRPAGNRGFHIFQISGQRDLEPGVNDRV